MGFAAICRELSAGENFEGRKQSCHYQYNLAYVCGRKWGSEEGALGVVVVGVL